MHVYVYVCCLQANVCGVQDPLKAYITISAYIHVCIQVHVTCMPTCLSPIFTCTSTCVYMYMFFSTIGTCIIHVTITINVLHAHVMVVSILCICMY